MWTEMSQLKKTEEKKKEQATKRNINITYLSQ